MPSCGNTVAFSWDFGYAEMADFSMPHMAASAINPASVASRESGRPKVVAIIVSQRSKEVRTMQWQTAVCRLLLSLQSRAVPTSF